MSYSNGRETNSQYRKRIREKRFRQQNGLCYYCKQPMVLNPQVQRHTKHPPNQCTIEHLYDRFHPMRGKSPGKTNLVAACWKCNNEQSQKRHAELAREELWKRSGRYPLGVAP